jgi:hypothetical protein
VELGHVGFLVAGINLARFLIFSLRLTLVSQMLVFETEGDEGWLMAFVRGEGSHKIGGLVEDDRGKMR